jgi:hypothetical protein
MQAVQRLLRPAHRYEKVSATELVPLDQSSLQHAVVRGCAPSGLGMVEAHQKYLGLPWGYDASAAVHQGHDMLRLHVSSGAGPRVRPKGVVVGRCCRTATPFPLPAGARSSNPSSVTASQAYHA